MSATHRTSPHGGPRPVAGLTSRHPFVRALARQWQSLSSTAATAASVGEWGRRHPASLAGCHTLDEVLGRIRTDPDATLLALLQLTVAGDELAGRVVVTAMLPKMLAMARRDPEHDLADYVGWLWLRARTYPVDRRRCRIAANLALDTLKQAGRSRRPQELPWRDDAAAGNLADLVARARLRDGLDHHSDVGSLTAARVIRAAARLGLVDAPTARILHTVYAEGLPGKAAALRYGISVDNLRWRCSQAVRRLAAHSADLLDAA